MGKHRVIAEPAIVLPPVLACALGVPAAPRTSVERMIEAMIAALDRIDGDTDVEFNGDELDGTTSEDDFGRHRAMRNQPGCPISDPGGCEHDGREPEDHETCSDADWIEKPRYGIDQSRDPLNLVDIRQSQIAREMGFIKTATGWRKPSLPEQGRR